MMSPQEGRRSRLHPLLVLMLFWVGVGAVEWTGFAKEKNLGSSSKPQAFRGLASNPSPQSSERSRLPSPSFDWDAVTLSQIKRPPDSFLFKPVEGSPFRLQPNLDLQSSPSFQRGLLWDPSL